MIKINTLYYGIVEDVQDPFFFGRLRVRIFGVHTEDKTAIPTESLPWCDVFLPANQPFISGIGISPTGMVCGQMVILAPKDEMLQEWVVMFSAGGMRKGYKNPAIGFNDPSGYYPVSTTNHDTNILARGTSGATVDTIGEGVAIELPNGYGAAVDKVVNKTSSEVAKPIDTGEPVPPATPLDTGETPWMNFAVAELGKNERDNPDRIKEYHTQGGGSSKWGGEMPWCASFVGWALKQAGYKGSGSAMARSYMKNGTDFSDKTPIPYGSIIVVTGNRGASSGHVCFATGEANGRVQVVGGNQGNKNDQNGGEVTRSSFPKSSVIGIRWPNK